MTTIYKVTVGMHTYCSTQDLAHAMKRADKLSQSHNGVSVVVTEEKVIWRNEASKRLIQNIHGVE